MLIWISVISSRIRLLSLLFKSYCLSSSESGLPTFRRRRKVRAGSSKFRQGSQRGDSSVDGGVQRGECSIPPRVHPSSQANDAAQCSSDMKTSLFCLLQRRQQSLRRLKIYLCSTMGSERLSGLALLTVHRTMPLDIEDILNCFRDIKSRRIPLWFFTFVFLRETCLGWRYVLSVYHKLFP